jgi:hypothetical protein
MGDAQIIAQVDRVHDAVHKAHDSGTFEDRRTALLECDHLYTLLSRELIDRPEGK